MSDNLPRELLSATDKMDESFKEDASEVAFEQAGGLGLQAYGMAKQAKDLLGIARTLNNTAVSLARATDENEAQRASLHRQAKLLQELEGVVGSYVKLLEE